MNDKVAVHRTKELRLLVKNACIDHIALATMDMAAWETLFRCMGFEVDDVYRPDPKSIDKGRTSMHTVVVSAGGTPPAPLPAQFALMEGINATLANDQITEYVSRFGDFVVQHIALRIDSDIFRLAKLWQELGIRFRVGVPEIFRPDLPEFPVAPRLRTLRAEHRPDIKQLANWIRLG